jgi:hypothetical protein
MGVGSSNGHVANSHVANGGAEDDATYFSEPSSTSIRAAHTYARELNTDPQRHKDPIRKTIRSKEDLFLAAALRLCGSVFDPSGSRARRANECTAQRSKTIRSTTRGRA